MVNTVYTIGYSGFKIDDFVKILKINGISLVVDVRSKPYSRYYTDYNKENLVAKLAKSNIYYRNYCDEFGARQGDRLYYPNGYLDFEIFSKSKAFLSGIEKLKKAMEKNYKFVLLCSEKDPINCHRTILVARAFHMDGYKIIHLIPNENYLTQEDIEERMLNKYFPDRDQTNMFVPLLSRCELIDETYRQQNKNIGYTIDEEEL